MPKGASAFRPKWRCMKLPHLAKIRKGFFKGQEKEYTQKEATQHN